MARTYGVPKKVSEKTNAEVRQRMGEIRSEMKAASPVGKVVKAVKYGSEISDLAGAMLDRKWTKSDFAEHYIAPAPKKTKS